MNNGPCKGCLGESVRILRQLREATLVRCDQCDLVTLVSENNDSLRIYSKDYYEQYYRPRERSQRAYFESILNRLEFPGNDLRVLDVGCGSGVFMACAAAKGWNVTGIDPSDAAVEESKRQLGDDPGTSRVFHGFVTDSSFHDESFDVITFWDSLLCIPDLHGTLSHVVSRLQKGGRLVIKAPHRPINTIKWYLAWSRLYIPLTLGALHAGSQLHYLTPKNLENIGATLGLDLVEWFPTNEVEFPRKRRLRFQNPLYTAQSRIEGIGNWLAGFTSFVAVFGK